MGEDGPTGETPRRIRRLGDHPEKVGPRANSEPITGGIFDEPILLTPDEDRIDKASFASQEVAAYFRGKKLPTHVITPPGVVYYSKAEDIPTESFRNRIAPSKIDGWETREGISNEICKPEPGEPPDSSFKFMPETGMYVKVIRTKEEGTGKDFKKTSIICWQPYNDINENTAFADIRLA